MAKKSKKVCGTCKHFQSMDGAWDPGPCALQKPPSTAKPVTHGEWEKHRKTWKSKETAACKKYKASPGRVEAYRTGSI